MRVVVNTDVVVAAMRSPSGASAALLGLLLKGEGVWLLSVAMALECEAICMLADHRLAANATAKDVINLLDAIFDVIVPVEVHYQWRPQLTDASDEIVLEAAVNGRADAIVSFNHKDYRDAPRRFGIGLRTPAEILREIRR
jgi:putative PIN family toxin of toxin-antitoxin system